MQCSLIDHFRCPASLFHGAIQWDETMNLATRCGASSGPEMLRNLRLELYPEAAAAKRKLCEDHSIRSFYYGVRPFLPVAIRKWVQRAYFSGWHRIAFPEWPVDFTADRILESSLTTTMRTHCCDAVPFVWFWPHGRKSCVLITHDVESESGMQFVPELMDVDQSYGVASSFQLIPEQRYRVSQQFLHNVRQRGFEANVHDLKHDGSLFGSHDQFARQVWKINEYGQRWEAHGFRAGALYRRQEWFDLLQFEYDMSVPTVGNLEPQHGGCCSVFPYFIGNVLELPVTLTQDYTLFHVLGDYSVGVWRKEIDAICARHGLIHLIVHPDYLREKRARHAYEELLRLLCGMRQSHQLYFALPADLNRWWRSRHETTIVRFGSEWAILGPAAEQATIAVARIEGEHLVFDVSSPQDLGVSVA